MNREKLKILMTVAVSKALDYQKIKTGADVEETFQHIMKEIPARGKEKAAAIAAVDKAMQYKELEKIKDRQILQRVMNELDVLIDNLE